MALLTFDRALVERLLQDAETATQHREGYDGKAEPGLWLVGDRGIYLMSSGYPQLMPDGTRRTDEHQGATALVAYAKECDPTTDEEWCQAKRDIFGGDDGGELLEATQVRGWLDSIHENARTVQLDLTPTSIRYVFPRFAEVGN